MNLKFIFAVFLTAFTLTNVHAKMDSHKQPVLSKQKRDAFIQAGDRARDEGYEYYLKNQDKNAIAAYKIAKAYYE